MYIDILFKEQRRQARRLHRMFIIWSISSGRHRRRRRWRQCHEIRIYRIRKKKARGLKVIDKEMRLTTCLSPLD